MKKALILIGLLLAGCANMNNEQQGGAIGAGSGALIGGVLGKAFGGTKGAIAGASLGALGGYFVGSSIGARLDAEARAKAQKATERALNQKSTKRHGWEDKASHTHGHTDVIKVDKQADGGECKTVREVAYIKGEEVVQKSKYCRAASGEWEPRST